MKATLIDKRSFVVISKRDVAIIVKMDLYQIHGDEAKKHPQGFRFSWIAFNPAAPQKKVLFDSHPPKGPHFHIDDDPEGQSFEWLSLTHTEKLFFEKIAHHFEVSLEDLQ